MYDQPGHNRPHDIIEHQSKFEELIEEVGGGGGGVSTLAEVLEEGADVGETIITGPQNTTLDLGTIDEVNLQSDAGINIISDSNSLLQAAGSVKVESTGGNTRINSQDGYVKIQTNGSLNSAIIHLDTSGFLWIFLPNSAIGDGDLPNSAFSFWLDDTNGASKLKVKAKSADGTVVSGELALT